MAGTEPLYPTKFAVVGTQTQGDLVTAVDALLGGNHKATIVRAALNVLFGLDGEGHLREGDTVEAVAERVASRLKPVPVDPASLVAP